ncbi:CapA family protein [Mucilaginibacter frigoritolerans]|nr:CapA family protein [Mucilaginibacter frigoritolerans]
MKREFKNKLINILMKGRLLLLVIGFALFFSSCQDGAPQQQAIHHSKKIKKQLIEKPKVAERDSFCIAAVGDIMLGSSYPDNRTLPPDSQLFNGLKNVSDELHGADITFGNLEGALADTGAPAHYKLNLKSKAYLFRMPEFFGGVLKDAGFNVLSLANNHIGDFGDSGRFNTMRVLDSLGIEYGGQVSHPSSIFKVNGVTYGFCAFAPNSQTLSILDLKNAASVIQQLKQQCDIVIVSFHGGGEGAAYEHVPLAAESYISEKRGDVRAFAHNAIDAGADVILGNGPHVCRAMEVYKNRLIAYSLGNFCTYKSVSVSGVCGYAPLLKVYVNRKGEFLKGRIISNIQTHNKGLETDTLNRAVNRIKMLTKADFPESGLNISDDGQLTPNINLMAVAGKEKF